MIVASSVLGFFGSLFLRFDLGAFSICRFTDVAWGLILLLAFRFASYRFFGLWRTSWKYFSLPDLVVVVRAHAVASSLLILAIKAFAFDSIPASVVIIEFMVSLLLLVSARLILRRVFEHRSLRKAARSGDFADVIVLGAGHTGHYIVGSLLRHPEFRIVPVKILDDNFRLQGTVVGGVPVVGPLSSLETLLRNNPLVKRVIIAIPSLSVARASEIQSICEKSGASVSRISSFEDLAFRDLSEGGTVRSIEMLLNKGTLVEPPRAVRETYAGKRVLITGAGGSIGAEIAAQIARMEPASLVLLDNSELSIFGLSRNFGGQVADRRIRTVLASVRDGRRIAQIFQQEKPEIVFHAAAYKHVPFVQSNPYEAFTTNVLGTLNVLEAAAGVGVARTIVISSDKAVDPASFLGVTKKLAEVLVQEYAARFSPRHDLKFASVRFGNVLESNGSVVPLFRSQILSGGPVTVTHPDVERFFMSIPEAVDLVLAAGAMAERGETFVLDMGSQVRILDLARRMIELYGRMDVKIEFTGLRPGEKLAEKLIGDREIALATDVPKVMRINPPVGGAHMADRVKAACEQSLVADDTAVIDLICREFAVELGG